MTAPVYLCGHTDGIDCGSGQRATYDFVTLDKITAETHKTKWKGSWSTEGWYREMPCAELTALHADLKVAREREHIAIASWDEERQRSLREAARVAVERDNLRECQDENSALIVANEKAEAELATVQAALVTISAACAKAEIERDRWKAELAAAREELREIASVLPKRGHDAIGAARDVMQDLQELRAELAAARETWCAEQARAALDAKEKP